MPVHPPQQSIIRVDSRSLIGRGPKRLTVRGRKQYRPVQLLEAPAVLDEVGCQPVEQFGMRRPAAVKAEVAWVFDQPHAEVIMPHAVHDYPRREWIAGRGDPLGKRESTLA